MSANNFIRIEWKENTKTYEVTHRDYDTEDVFETIANTETLDEAVARANYFIETTEREGGTIEYGLRITPRDSGRNVQGRGRIVSNDNDAE